MIHIVTQFVDDGGGVVLLRDGRKPLAFVKNKRLLVGGTFTLLGFRDGRNKLGLAALFKDFLGWLALGVELPMPLRSSIRRVQNRVFKKWIRHPQSPFPLFFIQPFRGVPNIASNFD